MPNFAVIKNNAVERVVVAESAEYLFPFFSDSDAIIEESTETGPLFIGQEYYNGKLVPVAPDPSWTFDYESFKWIAPIPYPTDGGMYYWGSESQSWLLIED